MPVHLPWRHTPLLLPKESGRELGCLAEGAPVQHEKCLPVIVTSETEEPVGRGASNWACLLDNTQSLKQASILDIGRQKWLKKQIHFPLLNKNKETWPSQGTEQKTWRRDWTNNKNPNLLGFPAASGLCARRPTVASSRPWSHVGDRACVTHPGLLWITKAPVLLSVPQAHGSENRNPRADWDDLWCHVAPLLLLLQGHTHTPRQPLLPPVPETNISAPWLHSLALSGLRMESALRRERAISSILHTVPVKTIQD